MRISVILLAPVVIALYCVVAQAAPLTVTKDVPSKTEEAQDTLPKAKVNGATEPRKTVFDDPLAGVVVNRTITVLGRDFYQAFTTQWRQKDVSNQYTITIFERPSARFGSEIWVQFRQKKMFHTFLPPARAATKKISAMAVEIVYQNIADSEVERMLVKSPDLGPEEM
ncbi:MAG TPA: curli production assembly/transport protein CsgE [Candidimonas sp.]|nr:curli production assembly/transport protein CsgE [Candidimonas sp.]